MSNVTLLYYKKVQSFLCISKRRESLKNKSFNFKNHIAEYYTVFGTKT